MKMNKKGVTMLELVVVLVIIAIGAVLAVPNLGAWLPNYRLRSATRDVASVLRTAQVKAVSNNLDYRVSFTEGTGSAGSYILERNSGGVWTNDGVTQILPNGITLATSFPNERVVFRPSSTTDFGGTVTITNAKGSQRTITVLFSTGKITIPNP
jgi:type IV fimbrial biogenesis protein FimT